MDIKQSQLARLSETDIQNSLESNSLPLGFTGSTEEYFRIWIVNVLLTLATLGIYWAWAKVRTRRYFYANTWLDGHAFDYLARPTMILRGHLILFIVLVMMQFSEGYSQLLSGSIAAVGLCLLPFLIYKAHRFKAINSAYRNIRFKFMGGVGQAYGAYALLPLAGILIVLGNVVTLYLGLPVAVSAETQANADPASLAGLIPLLISAVIGLMIYPYFVFLQQAYLHGNLAYGGVYSRFTGEAGQFRMIYLHAVFIGAVSIIVLLIFAVMLMPAMTGFLAYVGQYMAGISDPEKMSFLIVYFTGLMVFLVIINLYIYVKKMNYSWGQTHLGGISFDLSLETPDLIWIRLTNVLAIILSLGLLIPWARIRRARYILSRIRVSLPADMESIKALSVSEEDALGDTAADFFDWDIGW